MEPVVASFALVSPSSSSWHHHHHRHHHRHAPSSTRYKQQYHQQTSLSLREQEAEATTTAAAVLGEISSLHNDNDSNDNVSTLRSVTFHNLPKNIPHHGSNDGNDDNDDDDENEETEAIPDLLADLLMEIGACSVSLTDAHAGTDLESPIFHEPLLSLLPLSSSWKDNNNNNIDAWHDSLHWAAPIWNTCNLTAHFPASINISHVIQLVQETFPQYYPLFSALGTTTGERSMMMPIIETVPNRDWVVHVQSSWKPIIVPGGGGSWMSNFKVDDNDERILQPSSHDGGSTLFVLQFPWHSNEDVKRAIRQQQQQQQTASSSPPLAVADNAALQQQQQQQGGQDEEEKNIVTIQLQGGIAFGTGEHATTQLCLQWLDRVIPRFVRQQCSSSSSSSKRNDDSSSSKEHDNNDVLRILDYGAGSGILGIAALKLAAAAAAAATSQQQSPTTTTTTAHAVGIDIDVDACRIATANAIINNVSQFKTFLPPLAKTMDAESKSLLLKARAHAAAQQQQQVHNDNVDDKNNDNCLTMTLPKQEQEQLYDVCVANILAAPLIALAPEIVAMLQPGTGWLGMSGILPQQGQAVVQAYTAAGLEHVCVEQEMGGWILVTGRRKE